MKILDQKETEQALLTLPGWTLEGDRLIKKFDFANFPEALIFIAKVGKLAEEMQHHPEIYNSYTIIVLRLSTHDPKGITEKDITLAKKIEEL